MESKNRTVWIVVIVVLVIACCCALVVAAVAVGWLVSVYAETGVEPFELGGQYRERVEETFAVGDAPSLQITNFAGSISIQAGGEDEVRVVATKRASSQNRLDRIELSMSEANGRVVIETRKSFTTGNGSVQLKITAPADSSVDVDTGAGEVDVRDITGPLDIRSGAGGIEVCGAQGTTHARLGAGRIAYEGRPSGDCRFETDVGEIVLRLPEKPNVRIDVSAGMGDLDMAFDVDGQVTPRSAVGLIGDGREGSVFAHTDLGSVSLGPR